MGLLSEHVVINTYPQLIHFYEQISIVYCRGNTKGVSTLLWAFPKFNNKIQQTSKGYILYASFYGGGNVSSIKLILWVTWCSVGAPGVSNTSLHSRSSCWYYCRAAIKGSLLPFVDANSLFYKFLSSLINANQATLSYFLANLMVAFANTSTREGHLQPCSKSTA